MPASCPPPQSLCTHKGPAWITFKATWQRPWGYVWGLSSRGSAGPISPWHQALWEHGAPTGCLGPIVPHPECLAEAEKAGMAGRAEWCQLPASSPVSAVSKKRETW